MSEFRFQGMTLAGKPVQGIITADTVWSAKKKVSEMAKSRKFKVTSVKQKTAFIYKVRKGEESLTGEQRAFTKEEVEQALQKMGYQVVRVQKKLFDIRIKPPTTELVTFVRVSADLLREKLPYNEILQLLSEDINNRTLREVVKEINNDLKQGKDSEKAFLKHEKVLGKFTAHMLGIASKSGNMAEIYESAAKFMERTAEFKKSIRSALLMPAITLVILIGAVIFYVGYIFPATAELFTSFNIKVPPMTKATLALSNFLQANIWWMLILLVVSLVVTIKYFMSEKGRLVFDKYIIRIPVVGSLLHKSSIEIFSRVLHALYSSSGENIEVIRIAAEASRNKYMEYQIKNVAIPMMLNHGKGLHESLEATKVFTKTALSRYRSGAETGTVRQTALQLANYYEKETSYKLKSVVDMIQVGVAMLITIIMVALTIVSSETAVISIQH
jgi:type IV pilus assembly protein PilC